MIKALLLFVNICINIFDYLPQLSHTYIIWQIEPSSQHQDTKRSHRNCFNDQKKLGLPVLVTLWLMKSPLKKLKFPLMELPAKQETTTNDTQILRPVLYLWNRQNQAKANKHENNLHVEAQDFIAVWKFSPPAVNNQKGFPVQNLLHNIWRLTHQLYSFDVKMAFEIRCLWWMSKLVRQCNRMRIFYGKWVCLCWQINAINNPPFCCFVDFYHQLSVEISNQDLSLTK